MDITPSLNASIRFVLMGGKSNTAAVTPEAGGVAYKSWAIWRSVTLLTLRIYAVVLWWGSIFSWRIDFDKTSAISDYVDIEFQHLSSTLSLLRRPL